MWHLQLWLACFDCKRVGSVPASDSMWQLPRQSSGPCYDSDETNLDQTWAMEEYVTYYGLICPRMKTNTVKIWSNKVNIWKEGKCFEKRVTKIRLFTVATLSSQSPLCRHHRHFVVTVTTLSSLSPLCLHCDNFQLCCHRQWKNRWLIMDWSAEIWRRIWS